jgi:site-specific DNA recombinase
MKVSIYARVSKADKDDPNSIPVQLAACRERAVDEGWEVVGEYVDEGISAWNPRKRRPAYEQMLAAVEAGQAHAIIVREQDRLLRQLRDAVRIQDLANGLDAKGEPVRGRLRLIACDPSMENDVNFARARDRSEFRKRADSAIFYSEQLGEKASKTHAAKAARGEWHGGGRRPFGFRVVGPRPFRLVPDDRESELIRAAARNVISGASLHSIVISWNGDTGGEVVQKDSASRWTLMDVRRVLTSKQVAGMLADGTRGNWDAILSEDEHTLVTAALSDPQRRRGPRSERQVRRWALAGSVFCGQCGQRMDGRTQNRPSGLRRQYVCNSANGGCSRVGIDAVGLERLVLSEAYDRADGLEDEPDRREPATSEAESEVLAQMRELEERRDQLADDLADGVLDRRTWQRAVRRIDDHLAELRGEIARATARPRRGPRTYVWAPGTPEDFFEGRVSELPDPWPAQFAALCGWLGCRIEVSKARARGIRFDPSRARITWG